MDLRASPRNEPVTTLRAAAQHRRTMAASPLPLHAAAAVEMLTDAIAHEAAQPMQALSSILRELQVRAPDGALAPLAEEGMRCLDALRVLQDELRDAVSPARGERLRGTWVQSVLAAVRERLQPAADAAHIALSLLRSQPWWLRVDGALLRRIVVLLADNAIRHSGGSTVTVRAFSDGRQLLIAVRDDGAGIAADTLAQLLGVPDLADATTKQGARHGHGLFVCRVLLARLRGRLLVRSSPRATTFFVQLPRPVLRAASADDVLTPQAALQHDVVAMLDDDAAALGASARLFEALGAQVVAFAEPLDLLAACPTMPRPPRLFILDYRLRDGTCLRVIEALRPWLKDDFHCVVLTGDDAVAASALPGIEGDVFVATKPLDDWALARILRFLRGETLRIGEPAALRK